MNWNDLFFDSDSFRKKEVAVFDSVSKLLDEGVAVYPDISKPDSMFINFNDFYRALHLTPLDNVKVVILGQDPYHEKGQANGLAFSVDAGVPLPPSLKNIFKELQNDLGGALRTNGDLSDWANQGVLLLNSSLSVVEGKPNSLAKLWEPVTDEIISFIDENVSPVVFVLWGNNAKAKKPLIKRNKDFIVESVHPSPLSANRGFFGSKPFSKVNEILTDNGLSPIVWE